MQLTGRRIREGTVRSPVYHDSALATDTFTTVVIKFHGPFLLLDQLII
jgi:hypothetical protein